MENTFVDYFHKWEEATPENIFLRQPCGTQWKTYTWKEAGIEIRRILNALQRQGLKKGDRVAILSANCAEWILCDLAILMGGFISVPMYANTNANNLNYILKHAGIQFIFIGKLLPEDWDSIRGSIPESLRKVTMKGFEKSGIQHWDDFVDDSTAKRLPTLSPDDIATIIYTSGTTGVPKGVIHTHRTILNAVECATDQVMLRRKNNRFFSYLPLSHAAERGLVEVGATYCGGTISFVESQETFLKNLQDTLPTHFFGVPRIWEKFRDGIFNKIGKNELQQLLKIPILSAYLKFRIKKNLGLHKARVILTGAAPMPPELITWFFEIDIFIREAYGMTENFNVLSMNPRNEIRTGSAGKIFANQHIIVDQETQEISQKCDWLMKGYYNDPQLTAQTIVNGYLKTGDMGMIDQDGYITLIGRVKDIFKTSKGEYITPAPIEMKFLSSDLVDQACVMGSYYPQPFITIVLSDKGRKSTKEKLVEELNALLNDFNNSVMNFQRLKKVIIVKDEWTRENGLLTPTLKMKRNALSEKYELALEHIYSNDKQVCWENGIFENKLNSVHATCH